jgi:GNAT superfamily N-acetyltransferase
MDRIDEATASDIPQLADLLALLFAQEADFHPDRERQMRGLQLILAAPDRGRIFIARSEGGVVGMVNLQFTISTAEGAAACWLEDLVVRAEFRHRGIGSRLLHHAVDYARAHAFVRITLLTDRLNEQAIRFYRRHSFRPSEMTPMRLHL